MLLGKLDNYMGKKMKLDYFLTPYKKINSKWMENTGRTPYVINHGKILYHPPPIVVEKKKKKIIKLDIIKLKSLSPAKEIINKVKTQCSEWEK